MRGIAEQSGSNGQEPVGLARALSVPVLGLLLALLLIYFGSPMGYPLSPLSIGFLKFPGSEYFPSGLTTIAILFGLSCLPGGLIGLGFGYLIAQNSKLASASLDILHLGQWGPLVFWWALALLLFFVSGHQPGRYFFIWTMSIPVVALGTCYHFLCMRHLLGLDWRMIPTETARPAVLRGLLISLVLALSVWVDQWIVYTGNGNADRHYVAMSVLVFFLIIVNWTYRSGIEQSAAVQKEIFLADLSRRDGSTWTAALIVLFFVAVWHVFSLIGNLSVSPVRVFNAAVTLFSEGEIWRDMRVSLLQIFAGVVFSGALALIVSTTLLTISTLKRWMLPILSLTYVTLFVMLPTWHGWLLSWGTQSNTSVWQSTCVACLSFYPVMQTVWALREKPIFCRILLAFEQSLPYGFTAILYGEMMSSTAGLGFATTVATATQQTDKAFAVFLITVSQLFGLSFAFRSLARMLYFTQHEYEQGPLGGG